MRYSLHEPVICDFDIEKAFWNTNFGTSDHKTLLEQGVLKAQAGYRSGYTLTEILKELGLMTQKGIISVKGKMFLLQSFYDKEAAV